MYEDLRLMRSLLPRTEERLEEIMEETKKRRGESVRERVEALIQAGQEQREAEQRYWHSTLMKTQHQKAIGTTGCNASITNLLPKPYLARKVASL